MVSVAEWRVVIVLQNVTGFARVEFPQVRHRHPTPFSVLLSLLEGRNERWDRFLEMFKTLRCWFANKMFPERPWMQNKWYYEMVRKKIITPWNNQLLKSHLPRKLLLVPCFVTECPLRK